MLPFSRRGRTRQAIPRRRPRVPPIHSARAGRHLRTGSKGVVGLDYGVGVGVGYGQATLPTNIYVTAG
jgi:hypothetical protein